MSLIVQKYGGSSVSNTEKLRQVAARVAREYRKGNQLIVVVSAMGDTTDHLLKLAGEVCTNPSERELDMLLSVGERISISLLALALQDLGVPAISFTGSQVGIITDDRHTEARILEVRAHRIREKLERGYVVVVAGFQGVSVNKEITTLGRGGSDTTAVALAAALGADRCELMKDVDGVFMAHPDLIPDAKLNPSISYDEMIEMANLGAGVLTAESVEIAKQYGVKLAVGSAASGTVGTIITDRSFDRSGIKGIVGQKEMLHLRIRTGDLNTGLAFNKRLLQQRIKVHSYLMNSEYLELAFPAPFFPKVKKILAGFNEKQDLDFSYSENRGVIGIVGHGLNFNSPHTSRVFDAISGLGVPIEMLQVSELKITWLVPQEAVDGVIRRLYRELME